MSNFFSAFAADWSSPEGSMRFLHRMTPCRASFILKHLPEKKEKLKVLDLGCGGGLLSLELLQRESELSFDLVDSSEALIEEARLLLAPYSLQTSFFSTSWENFEPIEAYDIIICSEMIEHVEEQQELCSALLKWIKPGGLIFISTINATNIAYMTTVLWAEHIARWLPKKTHRFSLFVTPEQLNSWMAPGICQDIKGMIYNPFDKKFFLGSQLNINYIACWKSPSI